MRSDSPAAAAGLRPRDFIKKINGQVAQGFHDIRELSFKRLLLLLLLFLLLIMLLLPKLLLFATVVVAAAAKTAVGIATAAKTAVGIATAAKTAVGIATAAANILLRFATALATAAVVAPHTAVVVFCYNYWFLLLLMLPLSLLLLLLLFSLLLLLLLLLFCANIPFLLQIVFHLSVRDVERLIQNSGHTLLLDIERDGAR